MNAGRETPLERERRLFRELSSRLVDVILSTIFDLRPERAARRSTYLILLFILSGFIISLFYYPIPLWTDQIRSVLYSVLITSESPVSAGTAFNNFFNFLAQVFLDPRMLQFLPVFLAAFFIAQQSAAIYLADIFELEDVGVARRFINGVALSGSDDTLRIKQGEVAASDQETPTFLIGGPGKVIVELDSVALFERADGTPHVIGPTGNQPGGRATLDGFERFRQAIDIRNHHVELRDQDDKRRSVASRSRDGIPVMATDVRVMFSLFRGENPTPTAENPYPFNPRAVENIVYKAESKVTPGRPNPSTFEFEWIDNMTSLIREKLSRFMSEHNLTEYLASVGLPEFEKSREREDKIFEQMQQLARSTDDPAGHREPKPPPSFHPRYKIKNLFAQFAEGFSEQARNSGVQLQWIGIGTWDTPVEVVPDRHLDAWKLSQENMLRDSEKEMRRVEQEEIVDKMKDLIHAVPIAAFEDIISEYRPAKKPGKPIARKGEGYRQQGFGSGDINEEDEDASEEMNNQFAEALSILKEMREDQQQVKDVQPRDIDHAHEVQELLLEYRKQFQETIDFIRDRNDVVPPNIQQAIYHIDNQIGHWAGRP